jgi:hypothetical protein
VVKVDRALCRICLCRPSQALNQQRRTEDKTNGNF